MTILYELSVVTGQYESGGEIKKRWQNIGHLHESSDGRQYITLNPIINLAAVPRRDGDDRVYVNLFEPKKKEGRPAAGASQKFQGLPDDGVPF
jgi:hypothetical protein